MLHQIAGKISVASCVLCIYMLIGLGTILPRSAVRLFIAVALWALAYAILLAYYSTDPNPPILPGLSGYVALWVAVLIRHEALSREGKADTATVSPLHLRCLSLLALIVVPPTISLLTKGKLSLEEYQSWRSDTFSTVLTLVAFYIMWQAMTELYAGHEWQKAVKWVTGAILLTYGWAEICDSWRYFNSFNMWMQLPTDFKTVHRSGLIDTTNYRATGTDYLDMSDSSRLLFGILKIAYVGVVGYLLYHRAAPALQKEPLRDRLMANLDAFMNGEKKATTEDPVATRNI